MIAKSQWIDLALLRAFEAEGTDAHRLCTMDNGWAERFGRDILISFRTTAARDGLAHELSDWGKSVEFPIGRVFARFLPKKNEERETPKLLFGNEGENLQTNTPAQQKLRHDYSESTDIFADETWRGISCGKRF